MNSVRAFRCLRAVQKAAGARDDWHLYGEYCRLREEGNRKQAFALLEEFLGSAEHRPLGWRQEFFCFVMGWFASYGNDASDLIPQPVQRRLIAPTFCEWVESDAEDGTPWRLFGLLHSADALRVVRSKLNRPDLCAMDCLKEAIRRDPTDTAAIEGWVRMVLDWLDYACHELPSGYLGDLEEDTALLDEAIDMTQKTVDPLLKENLLKQAHLARNIIRSWAESSAVDGSKMAEWRQARRDRPR